MRPKGEKTMTAKDRDRWLVFMQELRGFAEDAQNDFDNAMKALRSRNYEAAKEAFEEGYRRVNMANAWAHDAEDEFMGAR